MKKFIKLNTKDLEESLVEDAVSQIERSVSRKRMDLEDSIVTAKRKLNEVSTITSLKRFDSAEWVGGRNEAMDLLKLAEAELKNFNENFPTPTQGE